jgi:hypothetical protein
VVDDNFQMKMKMMARLAPEGFCIYGLTLQYGTLAWLSLFELDGFRYGFVRPQDLQAALCSSLFSAQDQLFDAVYWAALVVDHPYPRYGSECDELLRS